MKCKTCGADIVFCYKTPTLSFRIEDSLIVRDDAWTGSEYDNPYLKFYCSTDSEHDIDSKEVVEWSEVVEKEFFRVIFPTL